MKYLRNPGTAFFENIRKNRFPFNSMTVNAVLSCTIAAGLLFTACNHESLDPVEPTITTGVSSSIETIIPTTVPVTTLPVTEPVVETTAPTAIPTDAETVPTEPEATQSPTEFSIVYSPAYQKLLTLPNAEDFLCNEFGENVLAIYAEWIDAHTELLEAYPERWYMKKFAEGGAGFFCHSPLEEDNSCDYLAMYMHIGSLYSEPISGRRYFTDISREEIAGLIYGAFDPIGVEDEIKERFIEEALNSEYFAWNVLDPEFRYECYYEVVTICPYPEWEPENTFDRIQLTFHVWRPGMAEDEYFDCGLGYDTDSHQVGFIVDSSEGLLSGVISN